MLSPIKCGQTKVVDKMLTAGVTDTPDFVLISTCDTHMRLISQGITMLATPPHTHTHTHKIEGHIPGVHERTQSIKCYSRSKALRSFVDTRYTSELH